METDSSQASGVGPELDTPDIWLSASDEQIVELMKSASDTEAISSASKLADQNSDQLLHAGALALSEEIGDAKEEILQRLVSLIIEFHRECPRQ
jgi:hypothetical protein